MSGKVSKINLYNLMGVYETVEIPKQYAYKNNNSLSGVYKTLKKIKSSILV